MLKIITWNINGLRSILRKNFHSFVAEHQPDILCLQETRVDEKSCPVIEGFSHTFFHHCTCKKGYSGTAIFSQISPLQVRYLDVDAEHPEGRIIVAEFPRFFLINTYVPNSQNDLRRLSYRVHIWDTAIRSFLKRLEATKPILWCGDLNVAHQPIDLFDPQHNHENAGFTDEERQSFSEHLKAGFVDVFRHFHPQQPKCYTWWSYRMHARERNIGWRIDYFLSSPPLLPFLSSCKILSQVNGSDHAPVEVILKETSPKL